MSVDDFMEALKVVKDHTSKWLQEMERQWHSEHANRLQVIRARWFIVVIVCLFLSPLVAGALSRCNLAFDGGRNIRNPVVLPIPTAPPRRMTSVPSFYPARGETLQFNGYSPFIALFVETVDGVTKCRSIYIEKGFMPLNERFDFAPIDYTPDDGRSFDHRVEAFELDASAIPKPEDFRAVLKGFKGKWTEVWWVVIGRTDQLGRAAKNEKLGLERAKTVAKELVAQGALPQQIFVTSRAAADASRDSVMDAKSRNCQIIAIPNPYAEPAMSYAVEDRETSFSPARATQTANR